MASCPGAEEAKKPQKPHQNYDDYYAQYWDDVKLICNFVFCSVCSALH